MSPIFDSDFQVEGIKQNCHCVKNVRVRSFSGPYFSTFGLSTERRGVSHHIQSECGKTRTGKTPNTDTFQAVIILFYFFNLEV